MATPPYAATRDAAAGAKRTTERTLARLWDSSWVALLGIFLMILGVLLISLLIALWPAVLKAAANPGGTERKFSWFGYDYMLTSDAALLLVVVLVSALGSFVHAATSFVDYVGNRQLRASWVWWYLLRVLVGSSLALLFYFAIRGGLFAADTEKINPYGIAAVAGLVGLFSKQATDKLRELFDTAFRVAPGYGDDVRGDSITNPAPVLRGSDPAELVAGGELEIDLEGEGFVADSIVQVRRVDAGGAALVPRETKQLGPTRLRVLLQPEDIGGAGLLELTVVNPEPGGGASRPLKVPVGGALAEGTESATRDEV